MGWPILYLGKFYFTLGIRQMLTGKTGRNLISFYFECLACDALFGLMTDSF